ncbi:sensor histidine kinase [Spirosoma rigui]|uniref:sensor histidine kinase n=1 Tax=Spirosoma rigui TaxID=564064 RepID=UPI001FE24ABF|nr:7TM-DISM domain-containing protein [Spirosoma rigui]
MRPLLYILLLNSLLAVPAMAQPVGILTGHQQRLSLEGTLAYFRDTSITATLDDIRRPAVQAAFRPVTSPAPNFGLISDLTSARPNWVRFRLRNTASRAQRWLVEIDFWCFDELQLFVVDGQERVMSTSPVIGWQTPVAQRPRHHRHFWFPFVVPAGQTVTAYLRVMKRRGAQILPIELIQESAYEQITQQGYVFWGGILFTLLFVALMSLFFFLTTLAPIYSKYIFCLLGLIGFFFINDGFMNQFAFRAQFWLPGRNVYFLFPLILFYSQLAFVRTFLSVRATASHRWHTVGTVVLFCGIGCLIALTAEWVTPLTPLAELTLMRIFSALYWLPMPVIVAYIIIGIVRGYHVREAWLYLVAVAPFYALNLGQVLGNFGLLPTYALVADYTNYGLAALFEVLVLTFGLAYRYKIDRDQTERLIRERTDQQERQHQTELQTLALKNELLVEKNRIARDLHDNVGAHLAFVVTNLTHISDQAEKHLPDNGKRWADQLRGIVSHTREAVKLLRETIWAIHQERFTVEEFSERLNQYINRYVHEPDGLQVDVVTSGSRMQELTSAQVLNLFRIVQEALNNVIKHARATHATVRLDVQERGRINLTIHDNGRGFTWASGHASEPPHEPHYGLRNMQSRAHELGGTFRIFASEGTTVEVDV